MNAPEVKNAKQFLDVLNELKEMVEPKNRHRMFDLVTAIVAYSEDRHAHELAERQRAKASQLAVLRSEDMRLKAEGLRMGADLIDPEKEGQ
ncbi:hypothetical protein [Streptomyces achromogenes]|uniref:hypothetical protein n=1 Tax=Streptomyces achromogenes TaxID=67255 RepID=UPI0036C50123